MAEHGMNRSSICRRHETGPAIEEMTKQIPLPGAFLRFIGVAEAFGAISLMLPGLVRIRQGLPQLAAAPLLWDAIGLRRLRLVEVSMQNRVICPSIRRTFVRLTDRGKNYAT
jgi:hypothetical protein